MLNYSVVITLKNNTAKEIEDKLRASFGDGIVDEIHVSESGTSAACYNACKANNHFGCVHWTDEDLQNKFHELKVSITAEVLHTVKSSYLLRHIDDRMVELGWEIIEEAIGDIQPSEFRL